MAIFWTMFRLELQINGSFVWDFAIDKQWLSRQKMKIQQTQGKVLFIVADFFCEQVYGLNFPMDDIDRFCSTLKQSLSVEYTGKIDCVSEKRLLRRYFRGVSNDTLIRRFMAKPVSAEQQEIEREKRAKMYNPHEYLMSREKLELYADKAIALFEMEKELEKRLFSRQNNKKII